MDREVVPVILAAGRGSRLGMDNIPKPMAIVHGRPFMQEAVSSLFQMGFVSGEPIAVIGHRGEVIQRYFGCDLTYCSQDILNGNAGALETAFTTIENLRERHVLTIQGDDASQSTIHNLQRMINIHLTRNADVTILTVNKPDPDAHRKEYLYDPDGKVVNFRTPIETVDSHGRYTAGIYLFSGAFLEDFFPTLKDETPEGGELGIGRLINLALQQGRSVFHVNSETEYVSVNTPLGLQILRNKEI